MSSNHLSIEPAPPENAHNHHSSLIEGCPLCYPLVEELKCQVDCKCHDGSYSILACECCKPGLVEMLKSDEIIQIHGKHLLTVYVDRRKRLVLPRKTARKLLHQQAKQSYSQGREDGIRELYNLYGEPRCEYLHHPRSTQHRASEECPVEKRIKLLLNQKQDEQRN